MQSQSSNTADRSIFTTSQQLCGFRSMANGWAPKALRGPTALINPQTHRYNLALDKIQNTASSKQTALQNTWDKWEKLHLKANLCDQKLGDALWKFALLTGQDHLQHVSMEFLHDNKDSLWSLKHTLQVYNARMVQILWEQEWQSHIKQIKEDHSSPALWIKSLTFFYWYRHTHSLSIITLKTLITCKMATSFLSWLSCLVGNLILSITLIATSLPVFLCFP